MDDGRKPYVRCKQCGVGRLHWRSTPDGWRLFNDRSGTMHSCSERMGRYREQYGAAEAEARMVLS